MISSIDFRTLKHQTYKAIKDLILKNELVPGQDIPIQKLATNLKVSETPVREALVMLKAEGLIDYEPHKKPKIASVSEEEVSQIYEVRKLIEPYVVSLLIAAFPKNEDLRKKMQQIEELTKKVIETSVEPYNYEEYAESDLRFNELFIQATSNKILREVLTLISERSMRIRAFVEATPKLTSSDLTYSVTHEHQGIVQAMLHENTEEAQQRVLEHLVNAELRTVQEMATNKKESLNPSESTRTDGTNI
jgi:DNA-binding GntR family transcriptional regulator